MPRRSLALILTSLFLSTVTPAASQTPVAPAAPAAQAGMTLDDVVAAHMKARGGADKWKAIQTIKVTGHEASQGEELPIIIYRKRPNFIRQEIAFPGHTLINSFDGTTSWVINPAAGPDPTTLTGPQAELAKDDAEFDESLINYQARGSLAALVGIETVNDAKAYHIKITSKIGSIEHDYIDTTTFLTVKMTTEANLAGVTTPLEAQYSNFKAVEGITMPFLERHVANGKTFATLTVDRFEFNVKLDDALFKMPGGGVVPAP